MLHGHGHGHGRVGAVSEPYRRHVGACRRNGKKKKKEDTRWTPVSGESYPFRCLTCVRHRHDAKNGVSVQPRKNPKFKSECWACIVWRLTVAFFA